MAKKRKLDATPADRGELITLLDAAKADPFDDAARLVVADWLEEHGGESDRARAEAIRLQIESANGGIPWTRRVEKLRDKWVRDWMTPAHKSFCRTAYPKIEGGLLCSAVAAGKWPADAVADDAWRWVETARPASARPLQLKKMGESPLLATVTRLDVSGSFWTPIGLSALMSKAAHLRTLAVGVYDGRAMDVVSRSKAKLLALTLRVFRANPTAWATLLGSDTVAGLVEIDLPGMTPAFPGAFEKLPNLRRLSLSSFGVDPARLPPLCSLAVANAEQRFDVFARLADSPSGATLEELSLDDLHPSGDFPAFRFPRLRRLTLTRSLNALAAVRLAESGVFEGLSWLTLANNWSVGANGFAAMLDRMTAGPRRLELEGFGLGDAGMERLAAWPGLAGVRVLSLAENSITDAGLLALARSRHATSLEALRLDRNNELTAWGVDAFLGWPAAAKLRSLSVVRSRGWPAPVLGVAAGRLEELAL